MQTITGLCKFCGQRMMIELGDDVNPGGLQPAADDEATRLCDCKQGRAYRDENKTLDQCRENIEDMFGEKYPEIADVMTQAMPFVWSHTIKQLVCSTHENGVAFLTRKKDKLVIRFTKKSEIELETGY